MYVGGLKEGLKIAFSEKNG